MNLIIVQAVEQKRYLRSASHPHVEVLVRRPIMMVNKNQLQLKYFYRNTFEKLVPDSSENTVSIFHLMILSVITES